MSCHHDDVTSRDQMFKLSSLNLHTLSISLEKRNTTVSFVFLCRYHVKCYSREENILVNNRLFWWLLNPEQLTLAKIFGEKKFSSNWFSLIKLFFWIVIVIPNTLLRYRMFWKKTVQFTLQCSLSCAVTVYVVFCCRITKEGLPFYFGNQRMVDYLNMIFSRPAWFSWHFYKSL